MSGACPACLAPAGAGARFCRSCGAALDLDAGFDPGSELGPGDGPATMAAPVSLRRDASARWWLTVVAVVVVLAAGWAVTRSGGDAGEATADSVADSAPPATDAVTGPTTDATSRPTTNGGTTATMRVVDEGEGPVLGRPVGWSVVLGDPYNTGGGLWRLDLDTGRLLRYPKVDGGPLLAVGDRLVMMDAAGSPDGGFSLGSISLRDPTAEPVPFMTRATVSMFSPVPASASGPRAGGGLWVYDDGPDPHWLLLSVESGTVLDEVAGGGGIVSGRGPELATSASWGLYRRTGDGYRLVAPGRPVVAAGTDVLLETCSSPTDCRLGWVDEVSGETVDRPAPPADPAYWWQGLVTGGDRFLTGQRMGDEQYQFNPVVFDLVTGQILEFEGVGQGLASSPDGRFLLTADLYGPSSAGLVIYDAETGTAQPLGEPGQVGDTAAVFVPNGY